MSNIKEIRKRHDDVRGYFADQKGHDAHMDRGYLLRQNELLIGRCEYDNEARDALCKELDQAEKRIAELEAEVSNLKAIMRGDGGTEKVEVE
jgi:hypothetical protein